jgi:transaldolase
VKLYADSANIAAVVPLLEDKLVHGVTTNPSIMARDGLAAAGIPQFYRICDEAGAQSIFMQATGEDRVAMRDSAERIAGLGPRAIVKVPATSAGFRVAADLLSRDAQVLLTAVYSLAQATFAASIGADYIAPYFGRLLDSGEDAAVKVGNMYRILAGTKTRVLVASVRSPNAAANLALSGVGHITADVPVLLAMMVDPVTDASAAEFERVAG